MLKPTETVDSYLSTLDAPVRKALERLRNAIIAAAPKAEKKISYKIPLYCQMGHLMAFFASKKHCSFVTMSEPLIKSLKSELKSFKVSETTIHFSPENPLPYALVKNIVKVRIRENKEIAKKQ